jgi:hypothetical protein
MPADAAGRAADARPAEAGAEKAERDPVEIMPRS